MAQPEESRIKTDATNDVLLRPDEDPDRRVDQIAPRPADDQGEVRVEQDGELRPVRSDNGA